jgi:preprotein translocase subunit SecD
MYLHREIIVDNDDIARSEVIPGSAPSRYGISIAFNEAGARKMRQATAAHIGKPIAILIDGEVVAAPVVRDAIGDSAVISGTYSKADAERIVNGMSVR